MDHLSLLSHSDGEIEAGVKLASGALASQFPTGPLHSDQTAAKERLLMKDLGQA